MACIIVVRHGQHLDNNAACAIGDDMHCRSVGADCERFIRGACASGCPEVQRICCRLFQVFVLYSFIAYGRGSIVIVRNAVQGLLAARWWHERNGLRPGCSLARLPGSHGTTSESLNVCLHGTCRGGVYPTYSSNGRWPSTSTTWSTKQVMRAASAVLR